MVGDDLTFVMCEVSNTVSSSLSSVTYVAKEFIENLFPKDYFKEIYITTTQASTEMSSMDVDDIKIRQYPFMSINPGYIPDGNEAVMNPFPLWRRGRFQKFREDGPYGYKRVFYNDTDELYISAIPYRIKFIFEYKFKLETHLNKIDFTHILRQKFHQSERFFINNCFFEAEIPNTIIKAMSTIKDYDLTDNDEYKDFCSYLNHGSLGNIHHALVHSTKRKRFTHTYKSNILVTVETAPNTDGRTKNKVNMADDEGEVEMELAMELWIPGNYIFRCKELPEGDYNSVSGVDGKVVIDMPLKPIIMQTKGNRTLFNLEKIVTDTESKIDVIPINDLFTADINKVIDESVLKKDFTILKVLFEFDIYRDKYKLEEGVDYYVDWRTKEIVLKNPFLNYVYGVASYIDQSAMFRIQNPNVIKH